MSKLIQDTIYPIYCPQPGARTSEGVPIDTITEQIHQIILPGQDFNLEAWDQTESHTQ